MPGPLPGLPVPLKAVLPAVPGLNRVPGLRRRGDTLPDLAPTRHDVVVDRARVAAYAEVCGFGLTEALPITYPNVLAFPLHLQVLTDRAFPFPAVGLVHLENSIRQHRPIDPGERLQVSARPTRLRPHRKGRVFDLETTVHSAGELVWESTSTYLRTGDGTAATPDRAAFAEVPGSGVTWRLPGDLGRRYAAVSGDRNPIHLYAVTAKAFGFPRPIAHGMWSTARCLAALQGRLPEAVRVEVEFRKPVLLPGTVGFGSRRRDDGYDFSLTRPRDGAAHLLGRTRPLA
ncbi:MaoC/PaaZ C-terminal domain-containing protein [Nocardioides mesophilus]|uniref:MaoC family dehydratase N-terminal domain-containing protein n=1 Tax=Nocardioides mesophilus TaxID=433659 RepID=A0A7G9RBF5_9ACTN|nr:MaoC/PaaZ C-terminal domain-containing protein [Nocardioides mesophilus]QNN52930.1 MaoC family dehydratase N-terminal domain-containing protein [Nocardioides mesophilus]